MRADQFLVERGLAASRSQAQRLIAAGARWLSPTGWRDMGKSDDLPPDAQVELLDSAEARYVSRGGLKLEGALQGTGLQVAGWHCLDVGQSTGGFTDCLLQHGAASVVGVDVGHGQLHPRLRDDARVRLLEGVNARHLIASQLIAARACQTSASSPFDPSFDLIVGDLSFISLTLVMPALAPLLKAAGHALLLVKPQFELQPADIGKGGVVRDAALYAQVEQRLRAACAELGWRVAHWLPSAVTGGDGNREFFIHAVHTASPTVTP
ncbi:TlyA family RNA methyltransferase [Ottowia testudinis]|uniref:TlyA family RNA methyltransferase n=1 Tax=Ottowia testudinis TaxID=2816950 RepID=A0A975CI09_9BURK|nr:TlyA family RNA methyltransferase [Ottowia testudinis]QTD45954.1 TlyA family RNA methyltransferase [Ottowia testudinis]